MTITGILWLVAILGTLFSGALYLFIKHRKNNKFSKVEDIDIEKGDMELW